MNTTVKVVIGILVLLLIALGAYYLSQNQSGGLPSGSTAENNASQGANSTSDAALSQDAAVIDAQLNGLSSDSAQVDATLNDQQITP